MAKKKCNNKSSLYDIGLSDKEEEHIYKHLHDIRTMYCNNGELKLYGRDEYGKEFTLTMCLYEAINWLDVGHFKRSLIEHIERK